MKGIIIFLNTFIICLSVFFSSQLYAAEHILVLKSKESSFYKQTINTLSKQLNDRYIIDIKNIKEKPAFKKAALIITLGTSAALFARKNYPLTPKVFTFIGIKQSIDLKLKRNETHLLIELKTSHYLDFANIIFPHKKIGVLYQKSITKIPNAIKNSLYAVEVSNNDKIISATRDVIKKADVLLALPNKNIFNRHSLKGILLSTYQQKVPLVSYSPSHVKAGAVAAIYASPADIGQHTVEIARTSLTAIYPRPQREFSKFYSIKTNQRVARSLGIKLETNDHISLKMKNRHK